MSTAANASPAGPLSPQELTAATNRYRAAHGLPALQPNPRLSEVAQTWTQQMADRDILAHNPWYSDEIPPGWTSTAENIAQNWQHATAEAVIDQWANSPGHLQHILGPAYTDLGVGVAVNAAGKLYATQVFAQY